LKLWEKVKEYAAEESFKLDTVEKVRDWMYANRVTPCDMEVQFRIAGKKAMDEICREFQLDCLSCLDKYLDLEAGE